MACDSRLSKWRQLTPRERLKILQDRCGLTDDEAAFLAFDGPLTLERADGMIENVVGSFQLPFAIAGNFLINGKDYLIPMVVEEPSIVAAASFMAKLARACGGFITSSTGPIMRSQIQTVRVADPQSARLAILEQRQEIIDLANSKDRTLVSLGGGCVDIDASVLPDTSRGPMVITHLIVDVRDAMGANTVNTMAEAVAPLIEEITGGKVLLRIVSNLADRRLARARVTITSKMLTMPGLQGAEAIEGILDAYAFAAADPYRATTHNKGIMNGIDPIVVATGNDWRAIEAGAHAWAARSGRYTSLTQWEKNQDGHLVGTIELPMAVGLVGGATRTHPVARLALKILGVSTARELGEVIAAVGLAQNLAALRALASEGIQRGHMKLHARNIAIQAGATGAQIEEVAARLVASRDVRVDKALEILREVNKG